MIESIYNPRLLYSNRQITNSTRYFICTTSCFYFGYSLGSLEDLSMASLFACNDKAYAIELSLITKKRKAPKSFLYLSNTFQFLPLIFNSMHLKICPVMFEYLAIFKYAPMFGWQFSLALASFHLFAD